MISRAQYKIFFITDQIEKGNLSVEYCPTDKMIGDFMTKPLQGAKYKYFADQVLGETPENDIL